MGLGESRGNPEGLAFRHCSVKLLRWHVLGEGGEVLGSGELLLTAVLREFCWVVDGFHSTLSMLQAFCGLVS